MLSKMIDTGTGPCMMGPIKTIREIKMKKVSTVEKVFILCLVSLIGGFGAYLGQMTTLQAVANGIIFGVLGAGIIGLLHSVRS